MPDFEKIAGAAVIDIPGVTVTELEVIDFCDARLAGFKGP